MEMKPYQADWTEVEGKNNTLGLIKSNLLARKAPAYYRSKAFVSQSGINPLITAAAPLFYLAEKFQSLEYSPGLVKLHEDLTHELKAFEHQAQSYGYRVNFIMAAQLIMSLWVDEMVLCTRWGRESDWGKYSLTETTQPDGLENKSFFFVLKHCLQDPVTYIDLLELLYLCLSLGFEGEYRYQERGYILLAEIRDTLFHTIQRHRKEVYKQLEITSAAPEEAPPEKFLSRLIGRMLLLFSTIVVIITSYCLLNGQLHYNLETFNETSYSDSP
ncbi:MAG TPA: type IVB secretion system protein IcmH/DotU [Gammaproteobacteria bacterium]|nr:type IVB secretion system protein IcmH/DotU [Gammaproteobacteria bacterium]